jgi:hypothetical protein
MPPVSRNGPGHRAYRAKTKRLRAQSAVCWLCGEAIDRGLPAKHPRSWTADHVEALAQGGELLGELRPAHLDCNARRGAGRITPNVKTSDAW